MRCHLIGPPCRYQGCCRRLSTWELQGGGLCAQAGWQGNGAHSLLAMDHATGLEPHAEADALALSTVQHTSRLLRHRAPPGEAQRGMGQGR